MRRLVRGSERRKQGDRRKEAIQVWREDLERRKGPSRREEKNDRRTGSNDRRQDSMTIALKESRDKLLGRSSRKWVDTSVLPETLSMPSPVSVKRVRLCSLIELGRCGRERDVSIYVNNVLAGAITHNDEWHVWRLMEACDVQCASELKMYMDRLRHLAAFPSLKAARNFVRGPFRRYVLAEMKTERASRAV